MLSTRIKKNSTNKLENNQCHFDLRSNRGCVARAGGVLLLGNLKLNVQVDELTALIGSPLIFDLGDIIGGFLEKRAHNALPFRLVISASLSLLVDGRSVPNVLDLLGGGSVCNCGEGGGNEVLHGGSVFFLALDFNYSSILLSLKYFDF